MRRLFAKGIGVLPCWIRSDMRGLCLRSALGIGKRLVDECVRFARQAGYRKITLWTQSSLRAARSIYGHDLVAETWDLVL
jgi:hypothetical protein